MPSIQSGNRQVGSGLVDAVCRAKLTGLTKEGGIADNWQLAGASFLGSVVLFAICVYLRLQIFERAKDTLLQQAVFKRKRGTICQQPQRVALIFIHRPVRFSSNP